MCIRFHGTSFWAGKNTSLMLFASINWCETFEYKKCLAHGTYPMNHEDPFVLLMLITFFLFRTDANKNKQKRPLLPRSILHITLLVFVHSNSVSCSLLPLYEEVY